MEDLKEYPLLEVDHATGEIIDPKAQSSEKVLFKRKNQRFVVWYKGYFIIKIKSGLWSIVSRDCLLKSRKEAKQLITSIISHDPDDAKRSAKFKRTELIVGFCKRKMEQGEEKDVSTLDT